MTVRFALKCFMFIKMEENLIYWAKICITRVRFNKSQGSSKLTVRSKIVKPVCSVYLDVLSLNEYNLPHLGSAASPSRPCTGLAGSPVSNLG